MTAIRLGSPPRQAAILATLAGLHVGVFVLVAMGLAPRQLWPDRLQPPVLILPPAPKLVPVEAPLATALLEYRLPSEPIPFVQLPDSDVWDVDRVTIGDSPGGRPGTGPELPNVESVAPALRLPGSRLAALIDGCYPSGARRLGEEGRAVVEVSLDAAGRIAAWNLVESSGFLRLDSALGCVLRRLEFVPGRRDGRAVPSSVRLPIAFRLGRSRADGRTVP